MSDLRDDNVSEYEFKLWRQYHAAAAWPAIISSTTTETKMLPVSDAKRIDCICRKRWDRLFQKLSGRKI